MTLAIGCLQPAAILLYSDCPVVNVAIDMRMVGKALDGNATGTATGIGSMLLACNAVQYSVASLVSHEVSFSPENYDAKAWSWSAHLA